jgi:WD40 repeat protein
MGEPTVERDPFEVVAESFLERFRAGQRPSVEEYAALHPELADQIRGLLPALVMVEQDLSIDFDHEPSASQPSLFLTTGAGRRLGDYRILREIARGGMGVVYEAEQVSLGRRVALKVLPRSVASDSNGLERFRREAKAAARLHHTNIVPVFEVGRDGDAAYYAMQFIQGQGLDQVIDELARLRDPDRKPRRPDGPVSTVAAAPSGRRGPVLGPVAESLLSGLFATEGAVRSLDAPPAGTERFAREATNTADFVVVDPEREGPRPIMGLGPAAVLPGGSLVSTSDFSGRRAPYFRSVAQIGRQAAHGLAYAHQSGLVHRDIKPSNLLLDHAGVVWITDFGLAKGDDEGLTHTGDILGTLRYMAPERFRGDGDARGDVYALGLTLYELLTLQPGFDSPDRLKLIEQIKTEEPRKPRSIDSRIPRDLETIVQKAIEKDPSARYQSAEALGDDLTRFLADEPIRARRSRAAERFARWARRNPVIAVLGGVLAALLVLVTIGSLVAANNFASLAVAERSARQEASRRAEAESIAHREADVARGAAEKARTAAQAETYRAMLSEVKALRAGRQPGWRDEALLNLARLAVMPTARRDLVELRAEATASLATPDIRLVARIEFPSDNLRSTAFSPDGGTLVTAGLRTGLDFWDVRGRRHLSSAQGFLVSEGTSATEVGCGFDKALYLAHDQGLAVATHDDGVIFTDAHGVRTARAPIKRGASRPIRLAIAGGGQRIIVSWTHGAGITVHDTASGTLLQAFDGSGDAPFAVRPDGRWLARQERSDVTLRPIGSGGSEVVLGRDVQVSALDFSPDGALLAGGCRDHTTMLWDVLGRKQFGALRGHRERVASLAFSPDGDWIATTSGDYTTRIWETRTGHTVATLPGAGDMNKVAWSPDGSTIAATTNWHRTIFLYRVVGRHDVQQWLTGPGSELSALAANPRFEQFTTLGGGPLTWDVSTPRPTHHRVGPGRFAGHAVAYSPDGTLLATGGPIDATERQILVLDAGSGEIRCRIPWIAGPRALAFDESGQRLASGDVSGNLVVWDLATNRPVRQFATGFMIQSIAFIDGERRLVTGGSDRVVLCNLQTGEVERRCTLEGGIVRFEVDRRRSRLVVAQTSGAIGTLSLPGLTPGHRLTSAHHGPVACLALSPDGLLLATGGNDHRVVLRDPITFETTVSFPDWTRTLRDVAFDCTSRRLAIAGTDSDLELWNLTALKDGLADVGLAWDQPTRPIASEDGPARERARDAAEVVVIRP